MTGFQGERLGELRRRFDAKIAGIEPKTGGQENERTERNWTDVENLLEGKPAEDQELGQKQAGGHCDMASDEGDPMARRVALG